MKIHMRFRSDEGWQSDHLSVMGGDRIVVSDKNGEWAVLSFESENWLEHLNRAWMIFNYEARGLLRKVKNVVIRNHLRVDQGTSISGKKE